MHIPDGYLAPAVSLALAVPTVPAWAVATQKVKKVLNNRTVPLLAIFSALSFTIMMFNVPVPGGTTAHGVGGTLIAVVLGPWAACIAVSTALILQALFFGDGGVLAIFANCLNMAIILPFVGYGTYRLLAAGSPILSTRRAVAAGIGAYVGITVAAFAVGVELGIEPILFSQNGHALYSPYGLREAVPAMVAAHAFGASIVEALDHRPGRGLPAAPPSRVPDQPEGASSPRTPPPKGAGPAPALAARGRRRSAAAVVALGVVGLVEGGGNPGRHVRGRLVAGRLAVGRDDAGRYGRHRGRSWSRPRYLLLPRAVKRIGTTFVAIAVIAPLGLIAPGIAYGEGSAEDVKAAFGYVPSGLQEPLGRLQRPVRRLQHPAAVLLGCQCSALARRHRLRDLRHHRHPGRGRRRLRRGPPAAPRRPA